MLRIESGRGCAGRLIGYLYTRSAIPLLIHFAQLRQSFLRRVTQVRAPLLRRHGNGGAPGAVLSVGANRN